MLILFWFFTFVFPSAGRGNQIFGELCSIDDHCIGHLICVNGRCNVPNQPTKNSCARIGYTYLDQKGKPIASPWEVKRVKTEIQCPPFCGYSEDVIFGPICVPNERGCARSEECTKYGRCGYSDKACVSTRQGCTESDVCRKEGWCGFKNEYCTLTETGCSQSENCKTFGYCGLGEVLTSGNPVLGDGSDVYDTRCVITPKGCAFSELCLMKGICSYRSARVEKCEGSNLKCFSPSRCQAGPPSPESYKRAE
ncbi:MAG: hypothetical protein VX278_03160 [Myxococcota bacterium]|nr:hypothetical protein [Myxococcota bacterium]